MTIATLGGVFPVLPTIFHNDGALDEGGLVSAVDYVVAAGADGVVFPGLASEYDQLSLDERKRLIAVVGQAAAGRARFIVGASADTVEDSAALLDAGTAAGASAAMVMTPKAAGRDLEALAGFYSALGARAGLPLMLQNAPVPMGLGLDPSDVLHILGHTGAIAWVKEENMPCGQRITALLAEAGAGLGGVFGGAGGRYIVDELGRGAVGTMPAAETPEAHVALMAAHRRGDADEVRRIYEAMLPILMVQAVFRWRLTKEILLRRGVIASAFTRAPGPAFDARDRAELTILLQRLEARLAQGL